MSKAYVIDGQVIDDIPSFYEEIGRVFAAEVQAVGGVGCLDSLNDMLHGVRGKERGDSVEVIWLDRTRIAGPPRPTTSA